MFAPEKIQAFFPDKLVIGLRKNTQQIVIEITNN
jgi:hypothetical protein